MTRAAMSLALDALKESREEVAYRSEEMTQHQHIPAFKLIGDALAEQLKRHDAAITALETELAKPEHLRLHYADVTPQEIYAVASRTLTNQIESPENSNVHGFVFELINHTLGKPRIDYSARIAALEAEVERLSLDLQEYRK